jgi:hypothetical protein
MPDDVVGRNLCVSWKLRNARGMFVFSLLVGTTAPKTNNVQARHNVNIPSRFESSADDLGSVVRRLDSSAAARKAYREDELNFWAAPWHII